MIKRLLDYELLRLQAAVQELAQDGPDNPAVGICSNLTDMFWSVRFDVYYWVSGAARDWPAAILLDPENPDYATEANPYCVPHLSGVPLWEGQNLEMRMSLLEHLAGKLKEEQERRAGV